MLAFLLFALTGCQRSAGPEAAPPPPQVTVGHPLAREIVDYDEFTARLGAVNSVEIRALVSGYLQTVNFKDGAEVRKGDLLFVIDPRPYQAALDLAQAALDRTITQVDLASNNTKRAVELAQSKAISAEELDTRSKELATAQAAQKIAQADLETAQLNLAYTHIAAPIDGRLSRALVTAGNLISAGNNGQSTLLTTLVSIDPVYAYADIDEATFLKYQQLDRQGLRQDGGRGPIPCELALGNSSLFNHKGEIDFIDNQIDSATGTLRVRGVFPNPDRSLVPGEFGRFRVTGSGKYTGLLIPDYAISADQDKKIVYVVGPDKTIQVRQVEPGQLVDGLRVIRSGLQANDWVALDRLQIIRPDMPVTPKETEIQPQKDAPNDTTSDPAHPSSS
ncbi:MAG: efflux RND transporter periplasmic adaptor subunit [Methylacidiphilales bacterium]|nr:efflux RND transporter periplasmic adaptor subunit [Candidatus Methylacidiphilales bacterium]